MKDTAAGRTLVEGTDYEATYYNSQQPNRISSYGGHTIRPSIFVVGLGRYAGKRVVYYDLARCPIDNDTFDTAWPYHAKAPYEAMIVSGGMDSVYEGNIYLPYRVNGYEAADVGPLLTIGYRPSVPEWWQYPEPGYFDVEALYDAAGERVDSIKEVGTYTVEVVKGKAGLDRYATHHFEVADDFRVTRTVEILPATIGDSSQYTTPNGGKIYERMDSCAVWSATTLKYTIRP